MEKTEKSVKKEQPKLTARVPVKCPLTEINKFLMCELCSGYLVDATAIIECQHTFCKSCILHYLDSNSYCPICDVQLNKAKPHLSLRADTILQKMVYKMVPGLFVTEVRRRREFAKKKSDGSKKKDNNNEKSGECEGVNAILEDTEDLCVLSLDDSVSLSLEYLKSTNKEEEGKDGKPGSPKKTSDKANDRRYLQCPAAVSVGLLKKFIRQKYGLSEDYRVDLLYNGDRDNNLENDLTLLDLAFMYKWNKAEPMCFHYRIFDKPVKATLVHPGWKRPAHSMMDEPPDDDGSSGQRDNSMKSSGTPSKLARISEGSSGNTGGSGSGGNSGSSQNSKKKCADSREEKAVDSGDVMEIDAEEGDEEEEEDEENEKPGKKSKKKKGRSRSRSGDVVVEKEVGKSGKRTLTLTLSKKYGIKQTRSCSKTSEDVVGSGIVEGVKITLPKSALQGKSSSSKKSPKKSVSSSGEEFSPSSSESSPCSSPTRVGGSSSSGSGSCGSKEGSVGSLKISIGKHKIVSSPTHHTHHHRHHKHKHHKHKKDKNKDRETRHSRRQSSVDAANKISNLAKNQVQQQQTTAQSGSSDKKSKMPTRGDNGPTATATKPDKSDGRLHKVATEAGQLTKTMNQLAVAAATAAAVNKSQMSLSKPKIPIVTSTVVKDGLKNMVGTLKSGEAGNSARTSPVVLSNQSSIGPSQPGNQPSPASAGEKDSGSNSRTANANAGAGTVPESVQLQVPKSVTLIPVNPNAPMASHKLNRNVDKGRTGNSQTFTHPITNKSLHQITVTEVPPPDNKAGANPGNSNTGGSGATTNTANTGNANTTSALPHLDKALSSPSKQFNGPGSMEITKIYCDNPQTKPFDIGSKKLKERKCLDITISPSPMTVSGGLNKSGRKILEETLTYGSKVSNLNTPSQVKSRTNSLPTSNKVMNVSQIQQVPATLRTTSGSVKGESATKQRKSSLSIEPAKAGVTSYPEIQKPNVSRKGIGNLDSSIAIYEVNSMHRTPTPPKDKGIVVTPVGGAVAGKSAQQQQQQQKSLGKRAFESVSAPGSQLKQTLQHGSGNKNQKSPGPERKREKLGGSGHHDSPLDLSGKSSRSPTDNRPTTPQQQQQAPLPSSLSRPKSTSPSERKSKGHASSASSASSSPSIPHNIQSSPGNNPTNAQSIHNIAQSLAHKHQQQSRDSRPQKSASPSSGPSNKSHVSAGHHLNIPNQNPLTHHSRSPPVIPIPAASPPGQFNPLRNLLTLSDAAMHMRSMQNSAMNHFAGYCANPSSAALAAAVAAGVFPPPGGAPGSALSPPLGAGMIPGLSPQSQFRHKASMPVHSSQMGKGSGLMSPGSVGVPGWPQALHMNMARGMVPSLSGPLVGPGQNPMASPPLNPLSNLYNSLAGASTAPSLMTPTTSNGNQVAQRAPPQLRIPNPPPSERISSSSNAKNSNKSGNSNVSLNSHQQQHHHKQQPQPPATALSKSASSSSTSSSASSNPSSAASHLLRSSALTSAAPLNTASRSSKLNGMNSGSISSIANSLLEQRTASAAAANTSTFSAPSSLKPVTKSQSQSLKDAIPNSMKISNFLSSSSSSSSKQGNDQATITSSSSSLAKMFSTLPPLMRPQSPPTTTIIPPPPSTADVNVLALKSFVDSTTNPLSVSAPPATPFTFTLTPPTATESVNTKSTSLSPSKTSAFSPKAVTVSDNKKSILLSPTLAGAAVSRDERKEDFCLSNATETTHVMKSTTSPPHRNPQAVNQAVRHIPNPSLLFNRSQQSSSLADRDGQAGSTKIARDNSIRPKSPTVPIISSQQHHPSKETIIKPDTVSVEATKDDSVKTISEEHKEEAKEQKVEKRSQSPLAQQVKAPESKATKEEVLDTEIKETETPGEKLGSAENQSLETPVKIEQEASVPIEAVLKKPEVNEEIVVKKVTKETVATVSTPQTEIPAVVESKPPRIVFSAAEIFGARAPEPVKSQAEDQSAVVAVPKVEAVIIPAEVVEAVAVKAPVDIASIVVMEEQKQVSVEAEAAVVEESGKSTGSVEEKVSESITVQLVQDVESISAVEAISTPEEESESMEGTGEAVREGEEEEKLLENVERIPEPMEIALEKNVLDKIDAVPQENSLTIQEEVEEEEELPDIDSEPEESPAKLAEQLTENLESVAAELTQVTEIVGLEVEETQSSVQNSAPEYPEAVIQEGNVLQLSSDASSENAAVAEDEINAASVAAIQETAAATEEFPAEDIGEDSDESNGVSERVLEIPEQNEEQEDHDELCMSGDGDSNGTVALSTASESVPAYDANENSDDLIIDPKAVEAELDAPSCTSASTSDENNSIELNSDNANPSPIVILNSSNDGDTARSCGSMEGKFEPTLSFSGLTRSIPEVRELQAVVAEPEVPEEESSVDLGDSLSRDIDAVAGNDLPASPVQLSSDVVADEPMEIDEGLAEDSVSVGKIEEDRDNPVSDSVQEVPAEVKAVAEEVAGIEDMEKIDITPAEEGTEEDGKVEKTPGVESTLDESQAAAGEAAAIEPENLDILLETSESAESMTLTETQNPEEMSHVPSQAEYDALTEEQLLEDHEETDNVMDTDEAFETVNKMETEDSGSSLIDLNAASGDLGLSNGSDDIVSILAQNDGIESENMSGVTDAVTETDSGIVSEPVTDSDALPETDTPGLGVAEEEDRMQEELESSNFKDVVMPNMDAMTTPPEELTQDSIAVSFGEDELISSEPAHPDNDNNSPPTMSSGVVEEEGNDNGIMMNHEDLSIPQFNPSSPTPPTSTSQPAESPCLLPVVEASVEGAEEQTSVVVKPEEPANSFHGEKEITEGISTSAIPASNHVNETPLRPQPQSPPLHVKKMDNLEKVAAGFLATAATTINNNNNNNNNSFPGGSVVSCDIPIATATTTA